MSRTVAIYSQQYDVCWGFLGVSWIESTAGGSENSSLARIAKQFQCTRECTVKCPPGIYDTIWLGFAGNRQIYQQKTEIG